MLKILGLSILLAPSISNAFNDGHVEKRYPTIYASLEDSDIEDSDLKKRIERCEIYSYVVYPHQEHAQEIRQLEKTIEEKFNIRLTTDMTSAFSGLNSTGGASFAPRDDEYLSFLKNFLERSNQIKLQPRFVPITDGILMVSVFKSSYNLYSYSNREKIYMHDLRLYVRSDAVDTFFAFIAQENGLFPPVETPQAKAVAQRRTAIIDAILYLQHRLEDYEFAIRSNFIECHYSFPPTRQALELHLSYFDQNLVLKGMIDILHEIEAGASPGANHFVNICEHIGILNPISHFFGSMFFPVASNYYVKRWEADNDPIMEALIESFRKER